MSLHNCDADISNATVVLIVDLLRHDLYMGSNAAECLCTTY